MRIYEEHCRNATTDLACYGTKDLEDKIKTYLITLTNQRRFNQEIYSEVAVVEESVISYHEIPAQRVTKEMEV